MKKLKNLIYLLYSSLEMNSHDDNKGVQMFANFLHPVSRCLVLLSLSLCSTRDDGFAGQMELISSSYETSKKFEY